VKDKLEILKQLELCHMVPTIGSINITSTSKIINGPESRKQGNLVYSRPAVNETISYKKIIIADWRLVFEDTENVDDISFFKKKVDLFQCLFKLGFELYFPDPDKPNLIRIESNAEIETSLILIKPIKYKELLKIALKQGWVADQFAILDHSNMDKLEGIYASLTVGENYVSGSFDLRSFQEIQSAAVELILASLDPTKFTSLVFDEYIPFSETTLTLIEQFIKKCSISTLIITVCDSKGNLEPYNSLFNSLLSTVTKVVFLVSDGARINPATLKIYKALLHSLSNVTDVVIYHYNFHYSSSIDQTHKVSACEASEFVKSCFNKDLSIKLSSGPRDPIPSNYYHGLVIMLEGNTPKINLQENVDPFNSLAQVNSTGSKVQQIEIIVDASINKKNMKLTSFPPVIMPSVTQAKIFLRSHQQFILLPLSKILPIIKHLDIDIELSEHRAGKNEGLNLSGFTMLQELIFSGNSKNAALSRILTQCQDLLCLRLDECRELESEGNDYSKVTFNLKNLQMLSMNSCHISLSLLIKILKSAPNIRSLIIMRCTFEADCKPDTVVLSKLNILYHRFNHYGDTLRYITPHLIRADVCASTLHEQEFLSLNPEMPIKKLVLTASIKIKSAEAIKKLIQMKYPETIIPHDFGYSIDEDGYYNNKMSDNSHDRDNRDVIDDTYVDPNTEIIEYKSFITTASLEDPRLNREEIGKISRLTGFESVTSSEDQVEVVNPSVINNDPIGFYDNQKQNIPNLAYSKQIIEIGKNWTMLIGLSPNDKLLAFHPINEVIISFNKEYKYYAIRAAKKKKITVSYVLQVNRIMPIFPPTPTPSSSLKPDEIINFIKKIKFNLETDHSSGKKIAGGWCNRGDLDLLAECREQNNRILVLITIINYCKKFKNEKLTRIYDNIINGAIAEGKGSCAIRSIICYLLMNFILDIKPLVIRGQGHQYIELWGKYTLDLGGADVKIQTVPNPLLPKAIVAPAAAPAETKLLYNEDNIFLKDRKHLTNIADTPEKFFEMLLKALEEKPSGSQQALLSFTSYQEILGFVHYFSVKNYSPEHYYFLSDFETLLKGEHALYEFIKEDVTPKFLIVHWTFKPQNVGYNSMVDKIRSISKRLISKNIRIMVVALENELICAREDFNTRFDNLRFKVPLNLFSGGRFTNISSYSSESASSRVIEIDLYREDDNELKKFLLDLIQPDSMETDEDRELLVVNPPNTKAFLAFWTILKTQGYFYHNDSCYKIPKNLKLSLRRRDYQIPKNLYELQWCKELKELNAADGYELNLLTYDYFITQYKDNKPTFGWIALAKNNIAIRVRHLLSLEKWAKLFALAHRHQCRFTIYYVNDSHLPPQLRPSQMETSEIDTSVKSDLKVFDPHNLAGSQIIVSQDVDFTEELVKKEMRADAKLVITQEVGSESIVSFKDERGKIVSYTGYLAKYLLAGKTILIKVLGPVAYDFACAIYPLFTSSPHLLLDGEKKPVTGKLILIVNDTEYLETITNCSYHPCTQRHKWEFIINNAPEEETKRSAIIASYKHNDSTFLSYLRIKEICFPTNNFWNKPTGSIQAYLQHFKLYFMMFLNANHFVFLNATSIVNAIKFLYHEIKPAHKPESIEFFHGFEMIEQFIHQPTNALKILLIDGDALAINQKYRCLASCLDPRPYIINDGVLYNLDPQKHKIIVVGHTLLKEDEAQQLFNAHLFPLPNMTPQKSVSTKVSVVEQALALPDFILTENHHEAYLAILRLITENESKQEISSEEKHNQTLLPTLLDRCGGVLIEGPSGNGKSSLIIAVLKTKGYVEAENNNQNLLKRYYQLTPTDPELLNETLLKAYMEGAILVIDEINTLPITSLLIKILGRIDINGKLPERGGFCIIATQNSGEFALRLPLDINIKCCFEIINQNDYSKEELLYLIDKLYPALHNIRTKIVVDYLAAKQQCPEKFSMRQLLSRAKQFAQQSQDKIHSVAAKTTNESPLRARSFTERSSSNSSDHVFFPLPKRARLANSGADNDTSMHIVKSSEYTNAPGS
jgi:hypothetical protein